MKYIFLAGSIILGIAGISQAMNDIKTQGFAHLGAAPINYDFQVLTISFMPLPGFARILVLSVGFFLLYFLWKKLKSLGIGKVADYIL